jgi:hypothetical protein
VYSPSSSHPFQYNKEEEEEEEEEGFGGSDTILSLFKNSSLPSTSQLLPTS